MAIVAVAEDETVITKARLVVLEAAAAELAALRAWGVDNWEGYDHAMRELGEDA